MQLILLTGFHGATISIMFLHIMHKRFVGGFLLTLAMAGGFGSGFLIISYHDNLVMDRAVRQVFFEI